MDLSRPLPRFAIFGIFSRFKVDLSLGMATLVQNDNNNIIIGCARQYFLSPVINHELSIVSLLVNPISRKINMSPPPYFPNIHCSCERVWQSISVLARQIHRSEEMFMCDRVPVYTQFPEYFTRSVFPDWFRDFPPTFLPWKISDCELLSKNPPRRKCGKLGG